MAKINTITSLSPASAILVVMLVLVLMAGVIKQLSTKPSGIQSASEISIEQNSAESNDIIQ